jgi:hypothetical protein
MPPRRRRPIRSGPSGRVNPVPDARPPCPLQRPQGQMRRLRSLNRNDGRARRRRRTTAIGFAWEHPAHRPGTGPTPALPQDTRPARPTQRELNTAIITRQPTRLERPRTRHAPECQTPEHAHPARRMGPPRRLYPHRLRHRRPSQHAACLYTLDKPSRPLTSWPCWRGRAWLLPVPPGPVVSGGGSGLCSPETGLGHTQDLVDRMIIRRAHMLPHSGSRWSTDRRISRLP